MVITIQENVVVSIKEELKQQVKHVEFQSPERKLSRA